jgi:hypothetical protein
MQISPKKDIYTQTDDVTIPESASNKLTVINVNAQSFENVAKMDGFVDRTMLIEELLQEEPAYVMMLAPSKFGKTLNLDMIRLFCDIEDKNTKTKEDVAKDPTMEDLRSNPSKNMKVFLRQFEGRKYEECLIVKREQFVIQHFGRHPVVLFNFKDCRAENKSGAIYYSARQVRKGYEENDYLKNSKEFQSGKSKHVRLKQTCTDWINYSDVDLKNLSVDDVITGLQNLITSLRIHWDRKPVFLVDEVDKPCVAAMERELSEKQVRDIGTTITDVICSILKSGDEQLKLQAALVTGICKLVNSGLSPVDNTLPVYFLSDERFSKYYGLTAQDVETLVKRLCGLEGDAKKTEEIISDINAKYNGYYQPSCSGEYKKGARYCLFSVLNYINGRDLGNWCFWSDGGFLTGKLVSVLRKSVEIMSAIQKLFYEDSGTIEIEYQRAVDVQHILGLYREEIDPDPNAVFNFFLQRGYLAHSLKKPIENVAESEKIYVRIPNLEIKRLYKNMFMLYYGSLPKDIKSKLTSCGQIFKSLPTLDSTEFRNELNNLCEHLNCIFEFLQCINEATICAHICAILTLYAGYMKGATKYPVNYIDDNNKRRSVYIDVWGHQDKFAIIFEVKYNSVATGEPGKIGCKTKSSLAAAEDIVELLPGKKKTEDGTSGKAGTGRDLEVLKSQIENYVLIGLAVDGDYTTHMLVFRDTSKWENVIQVNPEKHVVELISTHLK